MYYSLNPGDKIVLVSPSRSVKPAEIAYGVNYLKSLGFEVIFGEHVFDKFRYMAGTAENRAADIMRFYKEEEIKAAQTEKEALETICKKNESVLAKLTAILE